MSATYSYVARGLYADQLDRWAEHLPRERMLVRRAEDLFERPGEVYADVLDFAGLAPHAPEFRAWHSAGGRAEVDPAVRAALERAFEEPNRRLAERWGISWP